VLTAPALAQETTASRPDLPGLFEGLRSPEIVGTAPAPASLHVGHAEIRPGKDARLLVMAAAGRRCGWVLEGSGTLVYRVEDRFSIPLARRNLALAPRLRFTEHATGLEITAPLDGAALWSWEDGPREAEVGIAPGSKLPSWLGEVLDRKIGDNPARDMTESAFHGSGDFQWAAFHTPGDGLFLDFDARPAVRLEALARWTELQSRPGSRGRRLRGEQLVAQPIRAAWWEPRDPDFATTATEIRLVNDREDHATLANRVEVQSLRDGLRLLSFGLLREVHDDRSRLRKLEITKLAVDGQRVPYVHTDSGTLLVELPRALAARASAVVEIEMAGDVLIRPAGDNYWGLGAGTLYPVPTTQIGIEWTSFHVDIDTPAPFVAFTGGRVLERRNVGERNRLVAGLEGPAFGMTMIAGKYATVDEGAGAGRVHVATYASQKRDEARRVVHLVGQVRGCLEDWLGVTYPFDDLQLVELNDWGWGMAPPGMIFITQEAFLNPARANRSTRATAYLHNIDERLAHEVAHGWFPHLARVVRPEEAWLSESLAEYASALCMGGTGALQSKGYWSRRLREWEGLGQPVESDSLFLASHLGDENDVISGRNRLLYGKGPLVLHALRQELGRQAGSSAEGDRLFLSWLRSYVRSFDRKIGETRHLVAILEQMTGKPWQPWFERYVYGTETPKLD
jgi:hypothetical protein